MLVYTTAIDKLRRLTKPIKVIQGGTSAGKTEGIIANYINTLAERKDIDLTIVAESVPALKDGALKIFKATMELTGRWSDDHYNATDRIYTFSSGSKAQFKSFDTIGKAKAAGKRTHLFVNECQYVPYPIVDELMTRTFEEIIFDYNPNNPFYIQEEILPRADAELCILTYKDNEATPARVIEDFERRKVKAFYNPDGNWDSDSNVKSTYHANWCRVYIRGELGSLEGVIFSNWSVIDTVPNVGLLGYGMDFGYSNDPTTWIAGYMVDGVRVFDEVIYRKGIMAPDIAKMMIEGGTPRMPTYADTSHNMAIDEIHTYGVNINKATKGAGSIDFGISVLQEEAFKVTARSVNLIRELREYCWDVDREGRNTNKPVGVFNHCIDAMRYFAIEMLSQSNKRRAAPMVTLASYQKKRRR